MTKFQNIIVLLGIPIWISAQSISMDVIAGSGMSNPNNGISWTLGEVLIQEFQTSNNIISQGFHQGELIMTVIMENESIVDINVYPNPTISNIIIEKNYSKSLSCKIYNLQGALISNTSLNNAITHIELDHLPAGTYLFQILDKKELIEIHKIQKIK